MKKEKNDILTGADFNRINHRPKKTHFQVPDEIIPNDENEDFLKENLIGMEYDLNDFEDYDDIEDDDNWSLEEDL